MVIMADESDNRKSTLEEEAIKRKERLKNYKRKLATNSEDDEGKEKTSLPKPKFRSYRPQDERLKDAVIDEAAPVKVDEEVKDLLEAGNQKVVLEELDIATLAPRKPDWDLKRDVNKKLEKLERRTQKAIAELIWERLKSGENSDLGAMVNLNRPVVDED